ncbi:MAG: helix-turn-helix domain-containing protein [bacterium]
MKKHDYITIPELAEILGISRIAVFKKIKTGKIKAVRIGRNWAIPGKYVSGLTGKTLLAEDKKEIDAAVARTVREYGETLRMLGNE